MFANVRVCCFRPVGWNMTHIIGDTYIYMASILYGASLCQMCTIICVMWLIHIWNMTRIIRDTYIYGINVIWCEFVSNVHHYMCDVTHSYAEHDSFMWVTWLIHTYDATDLCEGRGIFIRVMWLIHMCDMTDSHVGLESFISGTWPILVSDMAHSYVWHNTK